MDLNQMFGEVFNLVAYPFAPVVGYTASHTGTLATNSKTQASFVIVLVIIQINYLNTALHHFTTSVVTPVYNLSFTTMTLVSSSILHNGFTPEGVVSCVTLVVGWFQSDRSLGDSGVEDAGVIESQDTAVNEISIAGHAKTSNVSVEADHISHTDVINRHKRRMILMQRSPHQQASKSLHAPPSTDSFTTSTPLTTHPQQPSLRKSSSPPAPSTTYAPQRQHSTPAVSFDTGIWTPGLNRSRLDGHMLHQEVERAPHVAGPVNTNIILVTTATTSTASSSGDSTYS
ncbi:hypothetical protein SmJEL517_g04392 [Synchytrium microbalum]|uniref:Uncharacterized protein n=1 Tax=Synchytrium microbalum TaxID=1806994 RepID=A0A507BSE5_9FUNG|nr:uncharacterized protein SmJEL517_g04392 [Synchytrium microbalum]TPX32540.1 hypothetical protein SmJEL517_g04392 [Synchytrium microbalum]